MEKLDEVTVGKINDGRVVQISTTFNVQRRGELEILLREHTDVYTWSPIAIPRVDVDVACHRLNIQKGAHSVKQKIRKNAIPLAGPIKKK